ncbi:MAG: hypothetical protein A2Y78_13895 [Acidobacteria bacterium RBG_13_68_16]|jgi:hypothetical protein|nr:MAG: hypothetical protein A2Y78_13895 [Acidobacteria bacterium RBG_13_68_16]
MQPDPSKLIQRIGVEAPLIGFYDARDVSPFEPLVRVGAGESSCIFSFYANWMNGETLHLTRDSFGCRGAGSCLFGVVTRSPEAMVTFLVDEEGLKSSRELMRQWIDRRGSYHPEHPNLLVGPFRPDQYGNLKTVTFFVNPDQLSALILGANYHSGPDDPLPVMAPFGSGCSQLLPLFADLTVPRAIVGATDIAMRAWLPPNTLAFTVTKPMFERLCQLDERSFLYKPFLQRLRKARQTEPSVL